jgi:hypothetical protein
MNRRSSIASKSPVNSAKRVRGATRAGAGAGVSAHAGHIANEPNPASSIKRRFRSNRRSPRKLLSGACVSTVDLPCPYSARDTTPARAASLFDAENDELIAKCAPRHWRRRLRCAVPEPYLRLRRYGPEDVFWNETFKMPDLQLIQNPELLIKRRADIDQSW